MNLDRPAIPVATHNPKVNRIQRVIRTANLNHKVSLIVNGTAIPAAKTILVIAIPAAIAIRPAIVSQPAILNQPATASLIVIPIAIVIPTRTAITPASAIANHRVTPKAVVASIVHHRGFGAAVGTCSTVPVPIQASHRVTRAATTAKSWGWQHDRLPLSHQDQHLRSRRQDGRVPCSHLGQSL